MSAFLEILLTLQIKKKNYSINVLSIQRHYEQNGSRVMQSWMFAILATLKENEAVSIDSKFAAHIMTRYPRRQNRATRLNY